MYNPNYYNWVSQGWQCPQCGKVRSPQTSGCIYCNTERKTFATTKVDIGDAGWWDDYIKRTSADSEIFTQTKQDVEITPSCAYIYRGIPPEIYI